MNYRKVDFRRIDKKRLTDDSYYSGILDQVKAAKTNNEQIYKEALTNYNEICRLIGLVYGQSRKEYKYIRHAKIETPPTYKADLQRLERYRNEAIRLAHGREYARAYRLRSAAALGDLLAAGFVENVDFYASCAITSRKHLMEQVEGIWQRKQPVIESVE